MINGRNNQDTTQNRHNTGGNTTNGNATLGGFSTTVSSVPANTGGNHNGDQDDDQDDQDPWSNFFAQGTGREEIFICENEVCLELDITFRTLNDLNNHENS